MNAVRNNGKGVARWPLHIYAAIALCITLSAPPLLYAQSAPKRLSEWLKEQPTTRDAYPLGLSWRVPGEIVAQSALRIELLQMLSGLDRTVTADQTAMQRLRNLVSALPVTGRVPVAVTDARWLEVNTARDPVLQPGDTVVLPKRPTTVTVITGFGERCEVTHSSGRQAIDYVEACSPTEARGADWTWVAQPDGRIQRFGVAVWNWETPDEPAPGAWIWAPPRSGGWPELLSQRLIQFLATQGPAPSLGIESPRPNASPSSSVGDASGAIALPGGASKSLRLADFAGAAFSSGTRAQPLVLPDVGERWNIGGLIGPDATASDWGDVGLMQTPSARMNRTGTFSLNASRVYPYWRWNAFFQPLEWFEAGFRYTSISNREYATGGGQATKDKSLDFKVRLWPESAYVPQVALGMRDISGTGTFSGEYLVGSKRTGPFDWSLGLGWGYVGARGNLRNPLSFISNRFDSRTNDQGQGGNLALGAYFGGPTALFGGVHYQTPWKQLSIKLEYDGNDYQSEPRSNNQVQRSPLNFGLVYRAGDAFDISLGVERGNTVMFNITMHPQLSEMSMPKRRDPPSVTVVTTRPQQASDWSKTSRDIETQTDWHVGRIEQSRNELRVTLDDAEATYMRDRVDRTAAVLHRDASADVDRFALTYRQHGLAVAEDLIDREAWLDQRTRPVPPSEQRAAIVAREPAQPVPQTVLIDKALPKFNAGLSPHYQQTLGGPDGFVLFQAGVLGEASLKLREDTWLQGSAQLGLYDNYDKYKVTGPSLMPRVRTYLREYVTTSKFTMPNLQLTHVGQIGSNQYYSVYGGYLESEFGGIGGEWLYRPFASRMAMGVDLNYVQQRNFEQDFGFQHAGTQTGYRVATGHTTLYWDTGWNGVHTRLSAGRYLAGDMGATVDVARVFDNGVVFGAYFTKTNVSAVQFGEGSFDKGVYLSIPFDALLNRSSKGSIFVLWRPLTRDGGAILSRSVQLHDLTDARTDPAKKFQAALPPNETVIPSDRREQWTPPPTGPAPYMRVTPKPASEQWWSNAGNEQRLVEALFGQDFRNIQVAYDDSRQLTVTLTNDRIHPPSRAIGSVARTALRLTPLDARGIRITIGDFTGPAVTYDFFDLTRLNRYFDGAISQSELAPYVAIVYLNPSVREKNPLAELADLQPVAVNALPVILPDSHPVDRVITDILDTARATKGTDWLSAGVIGTGLVLASSLLDRRADQFAKDHADSRWLKTGSNFGNALPLLAIAGTGLAALNGGDPVLSRTGYAGMEAGGAAVLAATGLKYAVGRARPGNNTGDKSFKPFSSSNLNPFSTGASYDSFPSIHTIVAWSVATPFALEYDAPWLYGLAGITNLARIGSRQHWMSDTVAGSLLGYGIGRLFWESSHSPNKGEPRVFLERSGVRLSWDY